MPYSLPGMIDAVRVNAAAAWNFVVVAELINSPAGLGYRIVRAQRFLQTDKIFAVLVVIGIVGLLIDVLLRLLRDAGREVGGMRLERAGDVARWTTDRRAAAR